MERSQPYLKHWSRLWNPVQRQTSVPSVGRSEGEVGRTQEPSGCLKHIKVLFICLLERKKHYACITERLEDTLGEYCL